MKPSTAPATRQQGRSAVLALVAGLLLRCFFVWLHPRFTGDTPMYSDLAQNLLQHHAYGLTEDGHVRATLMRLPGYPLFLALCFALFGTGHLFAVLGAQVVLDVLGCWLLSLLASRLFGPRVGLLTLWLAALCPFTANYTAAILTETPSILCVTVAFWAFVRWRDTVRSGAGLRYALAVAVALTGAVLLRPDGLLLAIVVLPAMGWTAYRFGKPYSAERGKPWRDVLLALGLLVSVLGVWTVRNWRAFHVFQPLAPKYANDPSETAPVGFARWYRTWATSLADTVRVYWIYNGDQLTLSDLPPWAFDSPAQHAQTEQLYERYNDVTTSTPEVEAAFAQLGTERIRSHPLRSYLAMPAVRLADMWLRPRTELLPRMPLDWWQPHQRPRATLLATVYGLLNLALLLLAVNGLLRWGRAGWFGRPIVATVMLGYVLLRCLLLMTIDNSEPRYVLECYPVVLLFAALSLAGSRTNLARISETPR